MTEVITMTATELAVAKKLEEFAGGKGIVEVTTIDREHKMTDGSFISASYEVVSDYKKLTKKQNDSLSLSEYAHMGGYTLDRMFAYMVEQGFSINHIRHARFTHRKQWYNDNKGSISSRLEIMWTKDI